MFVFPNKIGAKTAQISMLLIQSSLYQWTMRKIRASDAQWSPDL
jgi:hypothetical protein